MVGLSRAKSTIVQLHNQEGRLSRLHLEATKSCMRTELALNIKGIIYYKTEGAAPIDLERVSRSRQDEPRNALAQKHTQPRDYKTCRWVYKNDPQLDYHHRPSSGRPQCLTTSHAAKVLIPRSLPATSSIHVLTSSFGTSCSLMAVCEEVQRLAISILKISRPVRANTYAVPRSNDSPAPTACSPVRPDP
jgi:hypothetical protein